MGFFRYLTEDVLKIKIVKNDNDFEGLPITDDKQDITVQQIEDVEGGSVLDGEAIAKFRTLSSDRNEKYVAYENMLSDATIAAAIEMYADDATQYEPRTGKVIWAESDDSDIAEAANRLIDVLQLNAKAWRHIYSLCTYGDLYLRIYRKGDCADYEDLLNVTPGVIRTKVQDPSRPMEEYVEYVEDPASIYDLQIKDKTCGFVRLKTDTTTSNTDNFLYNGITINQVNIDNIDFYDRRSFVHISLSESISRNPELLGIVNNKENTTKVYKIKTGKSILADAYEPAQTVKLLEDSLLLSRLTKSALIRLLQIEVGDMPKPEVESLLRRVKNMIEQKIALNKNNGEARSYNSPGPMENIVYFPTKDGKGAITLNNLGGDVNIKDIADVDYFNNKLLSALKTPKQFLNYDSPEGLGNGTSLTKISSRYAHTVMRVQNAYKYGITTLLNLFFLDKDLDYINKFTIKMVSPATIEDVERDELMSSHITQCRDISDLADDVVTEEGRVEIKKTLFSSHLGLPDIADIIEQYNIATPTGEDEFGMEDDFSDDYEGPSGDSSRPSFNLEPPGSSFESETEFTEPGGFEAPTDFGSEPIEPPESTGGMTPEA